MKVIDYKNEKDVMVAKVKFFGKIFIFNESPYMLNHSQIDYKEEYIKRSVTKYIKSWGLD